MAEASRVSITVDVEGDFGTPSLRGVDEALPWLLERFEALGIRGTLFVVGSVAKDRADVLRRAADAGHVVASHSHTHPALSRVPRERWMTELVDSKRAIEDATGKPCDGFRAPYFDLPHGFGPVLEEAGYAWSSSKAPFSPIAYYRHVRDCRRSHALDGTRVVEHPVPGFLGLPLPEGVSWRRLFWPLTSLPAKPPRVFYLHPYDLLDDVTEFSGPRWRHALMTARGGTWTRARLSTWISKWKAAGAVFEPLGAAPP